MSDQPSLDPKDPITSEVSQESPSVSSTTIFPNQTKSCLLRAGVITILLTAIGGIVAVIWIGILLIFDPDSVAWINRYLPSNNRNLESSPQTLPELQTAITQEGFTLGESLPLNPGLLLPLQQTQTNCQIACEQIIALRVYQPLEAVRNQPQQYQLVHQITIPEIPEGKVLAVLGGENNSLQTLPLKALNSLTNAPKPGIWINTSGQLVQEEQEVAYGHIFYYDPNSLQLQHLVQWTSPVGEIPQWKNVTGDNTPELVINQTLGTEPKFEIYQLPPGSFPDQGVALQKISNP